MRPRKHKPMTETAQRLLKKIESIPDPWATAERAGAVMSYSHPRDNVIRLANDAEKLANIVATLGLSLGDYLPFVESSEIMQLLTKIEDLEEENRRLSEAYEEAYSKLSNAQQKAINGWDD